MDFPHPRFPRSQGPLGGFGGRERLIPISALSPEWGTCMPFVASPICESLNVRQQFGHSDAFQPPTLNG